MAKKAQGFSREDLLALMATLDQPVTARVKTPRRPTASTPKTNTRRPDNRETKAQYDARIKRDGLGKGSKGSSKKKELSPFQRVIDVLSRGNYASAEAFRRGANPNDNERWDFTEAAKGFASGLAGKSKTHFSDVLKEHGNAKGNEGKVGLFLDIFADPLTYTGVGLLAKGGKAVQGSQKVARYAERAKPDVVQLAETGARFVKRKVGQKRNSATGIPTRLPVPEGAPLLGTADELAEQGGQLGKGVRLGRTTAVAGATAEKARPAEFGTPDSPELVDKINREIAERTGQTPEAVLPNKQNTAPKNPEKAKSTVAPFVVPKSGDLKGTTFDPKARKVAPRPTFDPEDFQVTNRAVVERTDELITKAYKSQINKVGFESIKQARIVASTSKDQAKVALARKVLSAFSDQKPEIAKLRETANLQVTNEVAKAKLAAKKAAKGPEPRLTAGNRLVAFDALKGRKTKIKDKAQSAERVAEIIKNTTDTPEVLESAAKRVVAVEADPKKAGIDGRDIANIDAAVKREFDMMTGNKFKGTKYEKIAHKDFTPEKQANLFNEIQKATTVRRGFGAAKSGAQRTRSSLSMDAEHFDIIKKNYRHAENLMEAQGKLPQAGPGDPRPLRLSLILDQLDVSDLNGKSSKFITQIMKGEINDPRLLAIREKAIAGSVMTDTAQGLDAAKAVDEIVQNVDETTPIATAQEVLANAPDAAAQAVKAAGASDSAVASYRTLIRNAANAKRDELFDEVVQVERSISPGDDIAPLYQHAHAADKVLGIFVGPFPVAKINLTAKNEWLRHTPGVAQMMQKLDRAGDSVMLRLSTSRGRMGPNGEIGNMGKALQAGEAVAINNSAQHTVAAARAIEEIVLPRSPVEVIDLFTEAKVGANLDNPLLQRFAETERLMTTHRLRPDDIAMELRRMGAKDNPFTPTAEAGANAWKNASIDDRTKFMRNLLEYETAVDKALVKQTVYSDFAQNFGSMTNPGNWVKASGVHPAVDGIYYSAQDLKYLQSHKAIMEYAAQNPSKPTHRAVAGYDRLLHIWKTLATRVNPQYYMRNGIGETHIMWMDGVNRPVHRLNQARKVMKARGEVPVDALDPFPGKAMDPSTVVLKHSRFGDVTAQQMWEGFNVSGARQVFAVADNSGQGLTPQRSNFLWQGIKDMGDYEETAFRMAHWIDIVDKSKAKTFKEAAMEAGERVNRTHGNYGESTEFERKYAKRVIPFYTWQKKVTPILLESALRHPGKMMVYPKLQYAIAERFGVDPEQQSGLIPQPDALMPSWMRDGVQAPYMINGNGNTVMGDPGTPITDQGRELLNHPVTGILGQLTPALKAPMELSRTDPQAPNGRTYFGGGIPIQDKSDYLLGQVPVLSTLTRMTRQGPLAPENLGPDEQGANSLAIFNWFTGARLQENTARRKKAAEFEIREQAAKKSKAEKKKRERELRDARR